MLLMCAVHLRVLFSVRRALENGSSDLSTDIKKHKPPEHGEQTNMKQTHEAILVFPSHRQCGLYDVIFIFCMIIFLCDCESLCICSMRD